MSRLNTIESSSDSLSQFIDFNTLKLKVENLSERQKQFAHLIDPRFFERDINPFREGKTLEDYIYNTPIELEEELFYLHPFMDPTVLEQGNVRRFPAGVNEKYIAEKYFEDKWVSEGNNELSQRLEGYVEENLDALKRKDKIKLLDIGPCGGAITTLFALRALDRHGLLNKVELALLDIVPNVLEATILGQFRVPAEMISEYDLAYAGENGDNYKNILRQGKLHGVREWYEYGNPSNQYTESALELSDQGATRVNYYRGDGEFLPEGVEDFDIVLSAYTHHHMNLLGRKSLSEQMEQAACQGGFIGVADFYTDTFDDYMSWYKPHFEQHGDAPPVECPRVSGEQLATCFNNTQIDEVKKMERSFVFSGVKN